VCFRVDPGFLPIWRGGLGFWHFGVLVCVVGDAADDFRAHLKICVPRVGSPADCGV
jgi:hypothetical protein